ncbi:ArsC family reductase [Methylophaga sp.]|uniref:ArsC family reductase n=1 Tax=Methylophaga sp. TaxID=2024840 RepID=UPI0025D47652|nr:ArsC family reductase [Methylophaga sp.]
MRRLNKKESMIVYGIKNCDTVKKARRWLDEHGVHYQFHDFRQDGLDEATIHHWLQSVDWETLLNKRGTTWRKLDDPRKDNLDQSTAVALMLANPTLIKRPVVASDNGCTVGFKEADFADKFGK